MAATSSEESLISVENDDSSKHEYGDHGDSSSPDLVRLDADINDIVVSRTHISFTSTCLLLSKLLFST